MFLSKRKNGNFFNIHWICNNLIHLCGINKSKLHFTIEFVYKSRKYKHSVNAFVKLHFLILGIQIINGMKIVYDFFNCINLSFFKNSFLSCDVTLSGMKSLPIMKSIAISSILFAKPFFNHIA